ncbi:YfdX family protein [Nitrosomonas aestuarii]|uniref:YfdX protein n=1 Tax=Nitrosomonas aestuarii TaxID=52441 RepID=A0A1I4HF80_9PROT|nr:YfdX family protein [Nitrosomonas aestuarii]PTN08253.1 YfdX protein [Nitrosomonas aestuarii]SFL40400.1 YfdX protein [Nitrosomonas aestuarii]
MNKYTLVCGSILIMTFMLPSMISATDILKSDKEKKKTQVEMQREQSQSLAHKMMGHINLAQVALGFDLPNQAIHHIEKAQTIVTQLTSQLPELKINSSFKYGKVTYDDSHTIKEYYVPVLDDILLINDYEAIFKGSKEQGLKATDAGVVHVSVLIDLREVKTSLDTILKDINKKEYTKAQSAFGGIFKGAIIDEEEIDDPTLALSENLSLAKSFLNHGQYDHARFTLKYVQKRLDSAKEKDFSGIDKDSVKKLSADLDQLQADLRKKDPTMTQRINDRFDHWRKTIASWYKST